MKLDEHGQGGGRILEVDGQGPIFIEVIRVLSLKSILQKLKGFTDLNKKS